MKRLNIVPFIFLIWFFLTLLFLWCDASNVETQVIEDDLKGLLTGLARHLFGDVEMRWRDDYFPFTDPSFELDVFFEGEWMEVLGCGVIHQEVMANAQQPHKYGWAFGLGLERLAMVLFGIPDIRLFWSLDERFTSQFREGEFTKFVPFSKYPMCYKDVSFWLPEGDFHENNVYEVCIIYIYILCIGLIQVDVYFLFGFFRVFHNLVIRF
jgi:phenylalanyl-tRNA synthetase